MASDIRLEAERPFGFADPNLASIASRNLWRPPAPDPEQELRRFALEMAVQSLGRESSPESALQAANKFMAFLKGLGLAPTPAPTAADEDDCA